MQVLVLRTIVLISASTLFIAAAAAQTSVPQSYTLVVASSMALEAMTTRSAVEAKVARFGPREFVDVTAEQKAGQAKAVHARHWFDLIAHKAYSLDVIQNTCSWMTYTGPDMPMMYDPIATPAPSAADMAAFNKNVVRRENINGIAARLSESSNDQGKASIWIAENGNYFVKVVMTLPGAPPLVMIEVKQLRFEKPDAALLAPPANCTAQTQGEWSATGMSGHFEMHVEAQGSGSVDLKTGKATGDATVKSGSQPH